MRIDKNFVKGKTLGKGRYYLSYRLTREGYMPYVYNGPSFVLVSKISKKPTSRKMERKNRAPNS
jgi:hypothetical protein